MLCETLEHIASVTSKDVAETLAKAYAGTRLYVPKNPTSNHPLVQLIGMDNVQQIIHHVGYGDYALPAGEYRGMAAKAKLIRRLLRQGHYVRDVAIMADCCERTVWGHKRKLDKAKPSRQLRLPFLDF